MTKPPKAAEVAKAAASNSTGDVAEATSQEVVDAARKAGAGMGNLGAGFLAASVAVYSATYAFVKFREAWNKK